MAERDGRLSMRLCMVRRLPADAPDHLSPMPEVRSTPETRQLRTTMNTKPVKGFTETQRKMLLILADGQRHSRYELLECVPDEYAGFKALQFHISKIRTIIAPMGWDIVCEIRYGGIYYRCIYPQTFDRSML
jgi:hypothetical protein